MIERRYKSRLVCLTLLLMLGMAGIGGRLAYLHFRLGHGTDRGAQIQAVRHFRSDVRVGRGRILDRNGNILVLDLTKKELCASPADLAATGSAYAVAQFLGRVVNIEPQILMERLNRPERQFVYVMGFGRVLEDDQAERLEQVQLPGVFLRETMVRSYTRGTSLGHVLGYVNLDDDRMGSAGIEQRWDSYLRGVPGLLTGERDGRRREIYGRRLENFKPKPGADIVLTIDQYVQYVVEQALDSAIREQKAKAGWAIVQHVRTGEILAMASQPIYDPRRFREASPDAMRNRCIAYNFEPGSTFKVAVVAAALDAGLASPDEVLDCENGVWMHHGRPLRDFHPYGRLSVADVIKKSSNIGAAKIALRLGNDRLYRILREFGVGSLTGIELPGEEAGLLYPVAQWSSLSPSRIAIGHEVAVTALQMLGIMCTIANDGRRLRPYIVRQVVGADGTVLVRQAPVEVACPIRPATARTMRQLLARVMEEGGTGARARIEGYSSGGKTGTAQKTVPGGGYSATLNISSFMGFLPADDPQLAIIVVLDEPSLAVRTGGHVAGPVFKAIAEQTVRYLDIAPEGTGNMAGSTVPPPVQSL